MILLWLSRNWGLRYIRIKRKSELTGVDCTYSLDKNERQLALTTPDEMTKFEEKNFFESL